MRLETLATPKCSWGQAPSGLAGTVLGILGLVGIAATMMVLIAFLAAGDDLSMRRGHIRFVAVAEF